MSKNLFSKKALAAVLSVGMLTAQAAAVNVFASDAAQTSSVQVNNEQGDDIWTELEKIDFSEFEKAVQEENKKEESKLAKAAKWVIGGAVVGAATLAGVYSAVVVGTKFKNKVTFKEAFKNNIITNTASSAANKVKATATNVSNKIEDGVKGLFGKKDYVRIEKGNDCPANSILKEGSTTKCVAKEGYELVGDKFEVKCPEYIGRDKKTGECTVSLVKNASFKENSVVCNDANKEIFNGKCLDKCSNDKPLRNVDGKCVDKCPTGTTANGNKVCVLNNGVEFKKGKFSCKANNAILNNKGECVGNEGYIFKLPNGDFVKECPKGSTPDAKKVCQPNTGVKFDSSKKKFGCKVEGAKMAKDGNCGCEEGYEVYNNKCEKACAVFETRNNNGECKIKPEVKETGWYFKTISCKDSSATYDKQTGTCTCPSNQKIKGEKCECADGFSWQSKDKKDCVETFSGKKRYSTEHGKYLDPAPKDKCSENQFEVEMDGVKYCAAKEE